MEPFLKKYGPLIHIGFVVILAALLGFAVNEFFAIKLAPYTVPTINTIATPDKTTKPAVTVSARSYKKAIADRCLFGCADVVESLACPDGCDEGEVCQSGACVKVEPETIQDGDFAIQSDLNIKLLGSMVSRKPEYSLALVSENGTKTSYIVGIGDRIMGESEVIEIRRDRIIFRRNARLEYIKIENSISGSPGIRPQGSTISAVGKDIKAPYAPPAAKKAAAATGVKQVSANKFEIDRKSLNDELSDRERLAKAARLVPVYDKNGKSNGIKLINVADSSVYSKIGIKTGDIVKSINGQKIDSQAKALQLLDSMKNQSKVAIEVERRGKKETMDYTIK